MIRIEPYGAPGGEDVPAWYRAMVGSEPAKPRSKDPRYPLHFGNAIRAVGARYDGHPDLESVDLDIVRSWGEGAGSALLTQRTREALVDSYVEAFRKTPPIAEVDRLLKAQDAALLGAAPEPFHAREPGQQAGLSVRLEQNEPALAEPADENVSIWSVPFCHPDRACPAIIRR